MQRYAESKCREELCFEVLRGEFNVAGAGPSSSHVGAASPRLHVMS